MNMKICPSVALCAALSLRLSMWSSALCWPRSATAQCRSAWPRPSACCRCSAPSISSASRWAAFLANLLGSTVVDVVFGTLATLLACLVTYKLRDIRVKGLAIPASLPPVVFNMIIVGAFEITFFFSDGAPTAMLAVFNAVTVGIGELISCTILGVALVKLIESNAGLNKIFTEE